MNIYSIRMNKAVFFKHSDRIVASCVKVIDGHVYFKTDNVTKKYLDDNKIKYSLSDSQLSKIKKRIYQNLVLILSVFVFTMILYINTLRVSRICFNGDYKINGQIENKIKDEYSHFLFWDFISVDFEELSKRLRVSFSDYEWISAYKDGSTIYVVINNNETVVNEIQYGDIVAKKDAIVKNYKAFNGQAQIKENQYVKKGDVLISGNIEGGYTEARGVVFGETFEERKVVIDKEKITQTETGNSYSYNLFSLFKKNFSIGKKDKYESYYSKKTLKFNLFNFFKIYKIEELQICDIINTYTFEDAIDLAKKQIMEEFDAAKHYEYEQISRIELLNHSETDDSYILKFLLKKVESIGEFKRY